MWFFFLALRLVAFNVLLNCTSVWAAYLYNLQDSYEGPSFFDGFEFWTYPDPTHGFVHYVDAVTARNTGIISTYAKSTYIGVDSTNIYSNTSLGRPSVRIQTKKEYKYGLFVADIAHMPGGICGTWPAFWTLGPDWPNGGEIDILEGANQAAENRVSLHTAGNCTVTGSGESGTLVTKNCFVYAAGQEPNSGCAVLPSPGTPSYGTEFNSRQGGVYGMEWTSKGVKIWFFPRGSIPASIRAGRPHPATFGTPAANFQAPCIDSYLAPQKILFDTTFCGDYAGNIWKSGSCASQAATCQDYVANNPSTFADAYWLINSVKIYQLNAESVTSNSSDPSSVSALNSTSSLSAGSVDTDSTSTYSGESSQTFSRRNNRISHQQWRSHRVRGRALR